MALLYAVLWFLPAAFVLLLPLLRGFRAAAPAAVRPEHLALRIAGMAFLACVWIALVIDQWPCFFGVPNCDQERPAHGHSAGRHHRLRGRPGIQRAAHGVIIRKRLQSAWHGMADRDPAR